MNKQGRAALGVMMWVATVTGLHFRLNVDWSSFLNDRLPEGKRKLNVAYLPVT